MTQDRKKRVEWVNVSGRVKEGRVHTSRGTFTLRWWGWWGRWMVTAMTYPRGGWRVELGRFTVRWEPRNLPRVVTPCVPYRFGDAIPRDGDVPVDVYEAVALALLNKDYQGLSGEERHRVKLAAHASLYGRELWDGAAALEPVR